MKLAQADRTLCAWQPERRKETWAQTEHIKCSLSAEKEGNLGADWAHLVQSERSKERILVRRLGTLSAIWAQERRLLGSTQPMLKWNPGGGHPKWLGDLR